MDKNMTFSKITLGGIKNPLLTIEGTKIKTSKIEVYVDDKKIDIEEINIIDREYLLNIIQQKAKEPFAYKIKLPNNSKIVTIYLLTHGKKELYKTINIKLYVRIKEKINIIIRKTKRLPKIIIKVIKVTWQRHHFILPLRVLKRYIKSFKNNISNETIEEKFLDPLNQEEYLKWIEKNEKEIEHKKLKYNPKISIIIPVYNVKKEYLKECIESVLNQTYHNYEICIADDNSNSIETKETLKEYENDGKIKIIYRKENGHISECTNTALSLASGEYVGFLDNDDVLSKEALYLMVEKLNEEKYDLIYSDEDKLDMCGKRKEPHFKPDYSPDTLLSSNYICHFTMIKKALVEELVGFRSEYNGSQDYDLFLRVTEKTNKIGHLDKVIYHWRMIEGSTASSEDNKLYAYLAGQRALEDYFNRKKINAKVHLIGKPQMYRIEYIYTSEPKISIIIPTKDKINVLENCIKSIYKKTAYSNFEIIVIDNNSASEETKIFLEECKKKHENFSYYRYECEFNYSFLNNEGVKKSNGEYVILLNNDIEVIEPNWIKEMVGYASQKHIGCVGVELLYPTKTVQHSGVIIGLGGVAGHAFIGTGSENYGYFGRMIAPYNYSAVTAACLMISKEKYNEVNGLDENLKVAYNDVDFNLKCLNKRYYNVLLPHVKLFHYESLSRGNDLSPENLQRFKGEINYMVNKWKKELMFDKYYNNNLSYEFPFKLR